MALRRARFRLGGRIFRLTTGLAGLVLVVALGACSPVEEWRSLTGISDNDPDPKTAPFTRNMAVGEAGPYPNLASVPPPPVLAATDAERQKLAQSLVANRTAVAAEAGPAPPPAAGGVPTPPAASPTPVASATLAPAAAPTPTKEASNSGRRKADEPPAPQPLNSTLQMPQIPVVPQPEAVRPAPPPPVLPAFTAPPPASLPPAAVASVMPEPAPPPPVLAPIAPMPVVGTPPPPPAPPATTVATLDIPAAAGALSGADRTQIDRVAALYKQRPRGVRVIAYTAAPAAGADPLAGYHAALERAQAVAKALAAAGIPAKQLQTQAAPATDPGAAGRVAIQFAPSEPARR